MPFRSMSLEEFAKHVSIDAREVRRLAERGKLPGHKVGGKWRFNRARVTEWLQMEMHTLDERRLMAIETAMCGPTPAAVNDSRMVVTELIGIEAVDALLPAKTKPSVLRGLVSLATKTGLLYDDAGLLDAIEQREELCSTAFPLGVAVPHPRQPMPYVSAEPFICVARHPAGIAFGSADGKMTHLFFLICCHDDRHHLHVLARLMRMLSAETIDDLRHADDAEELLAIMLAREEKVVALTK